MQDYPSVMVVASKADDIIPFAGVQNYVNKIQRCTKQTRNVHTPNNYHGIPMPRGTILFHVVNHKDHYSIGDVNEVLNYSIVHKVCRACGKNGANARPTLKFVHFYESMSQ